MENDSTSPTSPVWPTRWPPNAFKPHVALELIGAIFLIVLLIVLLGIAALRLLHPILPVGVSAKPSLDVALLLQFAMELPIVILLLIYLPKASGFSLRELGVTWPGANALAYGILGAMMMIFIVDASGAIIDSLTHSMHPQDVLKAFEAARRPATIIFFAVFAIIIAPIAEELVFRVFLFNLGLRYAGFWIGAASSSIIFGIAHGGIFVALPLALGGIVLCGVYYSSRNAISSMISHALFNAVTVFGVLASTHGTHA
ncbi:MAG: CPBP family intramembrane glutamic endopeptidase [Vulcanimicrobiaceae bacterium]